MEYAFISFVGQTHNGTDDSFDRIIKTHGAPALAVFLHTTRTLMKAQMLQEKAFSNDIESSILEVPNSLDGLAAAVDPVLKTIKGSGRKVILNANGGMGYQVAFLVQLLAKENIPAIIEAYEIGLMCTTDSIAAEARIEELPYDPDSCQSVEQILSGQQTEHSIKERKNKFAQWCRTKDITLPEQCLKNVEIDGLTFDLVWNDGYNRLCYLICFNTEYYDNLRKTAEGKDTLRQKIRDYASFIVNKNRNNLVRDKTCYAVFKHKADESRFLLDTNFKGRSLLCSGGGFDEKKNDIRMLLKPGFNSKKLKEETVAAGSDTLITVFSENDCLTLNIIESFKDRYKRIVLLYTESSRNIKELALHLKKTLKNKGGYPEIILCPTDICGSNIFKSLTVEKNAKNVAVNITPGTKDQGINLSLWAILNGVDTYSVNNATGKNECFFNQDKSIAKKTADPFLIPHLFCRSAGGDKSLVGEEIPFIENFYEFMCRWNKEGKAWPLNKGGFPDKSFKNNYADGEYSIEKSENRYCMTLFRQNQKYYFPERFNGDEKAGGIGNLYEYLVSYALKKAGAEHVHTQVRLKYDDEVQSSLEESVQNYSGESNPNVFRIDIDVMAVWKHCILCVECKAQPFGDTRYDDKVTKKEMVAQRAFTTKAAIDSFAVPLLVYIDKPDDTDSVQTENGETVYALGWKDLCSKERLAQILDMAISSKRTTQITTSK